MATEKVHVYQRNSTKSAVIGPPGAHQKGDRVKVPPRRKEWPHGQAAKGFDAVVDGVYDDGAALAVAVTA